MKPRIPAVLTIFSLVALAFLPEVQAVLPAPDGGYSGGNTAEGQAALLSLTTGGFNTAVGFLSLRSDLTNSFNTAIGAGTLLANTADQNTATGAGALLSNTTGFSNIANGAFALFNNTEGNLNTANGVQALFNNTTGFQNTANGGFALFNNTIGVQNTAIGREALFSNTTGNFNTAIGHNTLFNNTTGSNNVVLGNGSGGDITTVNGVICIGSLGADVGSSCFIGQIHGKTTHNANAIPVVIDSADQLGTVSSSRRFKKEITPMDKASEAILGLNPVTFHYKTDDTNTPCFGLIAEEVAQVNPDLVVRDDKGEIYTVRYDAVNAMLLNEFLKEHRKIEEQDRRIREQEATITRLAKQIESVVAHSKEQDTQIQRVSDQAQMSSASAQTVTSSQ